MRPVVSCSEQFVRMTYKNNISAFDLNDNLPGHVDIPRLREGKVGGFFWSCFTACPEDPKGGAGSDDFLTAHNAVRGSSITPPPLMSKETSLTLIFWLGCLRHPRAD
jgi:hypothetical protein